MLALALAPALAAAFYIFVRDKYEKEPWRLLVVGLVTGLAITYPVIQTENAITGLAPIMSDMGDALYTSFLVAALTETAFKFTALYLLTWNNRNLNEPFDGIVYAVFIALGFAGLENVLYVFHPELGGYGTAFLRAFVSVPAHALFAVTTGYYFALARFHPDKWPINLTRAFFVTYVIHGLYDFLLLSGNTYLLAVFALLLAWMWRTGFARMKEHLDASPFRPIKK